MLDRKKPAERAGGFETVQHEVLPKMAAKAALMQAGRQGPAGARFLRGAQLLLSLSFQLVSNKIVSITLKCAYLFFCSLELSLIITSGGKPAGYPSNKGRKAE